jgi:hypothetical protein
MAAPHALLRGRHATCHRPNNAWVHPHSVRASAPTPAAYPPRTTPVPASADEQVAQAAAAIESAWRAGHKRQRVELLLPLIGATDLDDWPGAVGGGALVWQRRGRRRARALTTHSHTRSQRHLQKK